MPSEPRSSPEAGDGAGNSNADRLRTAATELYRLEPAEFVGRRKELAAKAREDGDRALAEQVAKLARPSKAAAALNHLVHRRPDDVDGLVRLAKSLQGASERLDGAELRELGSARRQLIAELVTAVVDLASDEGNPPSGSVVEEIEESLQAALLDEEATRAVTSGRLVRSLRVAAVGTVDLSAAIPPPPGSPPIRQAAGRPGAALGGGRPAAALRGRRGGKAPGARRRDPPEAAAEAAETRRQEAPEAAEAQRREAAEAHRRESSEAARRAEAAAATAHKELEKARKASEKARTRREAAEAALVAARSKELASSKALKAAEAADRQARTAREVADAARGRIG